MGEFIAVGIVFIVLAVAVWHSIGVSKSDIEWSEHMRMIELASDRELRRIQAQHEQEFASEGGMYIGKTRTFTITVKEVDND